MNSLLLLNSLLVGNQCTDIKGEQWRLLGIIIVLAWLSGEKGCRASESSSSHRRVSEWILTKLNCSLSITLWGRGGGRGWGGEWERGRVREGWGEEEKEGGGEGETAEIKRLGKEVFSLRENKTSQDLWFWKTLRFQITFASLSEVWMWVKC